MKAIVTSSEMLVEFWSSRRLPLNPSDEMRVGRNNLRNELSKLPENSYIRASYRETETSTINFDVENVLIYNVGTGSFPSVRGIEFAYENAKPSMPGYFHRYEVVSSFKENEEVIAETRFYLPKLNSLKVHQVWWAISAWQQKAAMAGSDFGIRVDVYGPVRKTNLVSVVKPLFDGIISSLQHLTQPPHPQVVNVLSEAVGARPDQIVEKLTARFGILGANSRLVSPYRKGVQWNPDDHRCKLGSLRQSEGDSLSIHAKLVRLSGCI